MKPIKRLQIGKNGASEAFIKQLQTQFKTQQLVKITILKTACRNKKEAETIGKKLIEALGKNYDYKLIGYVLTIRKFRKNVR